MKESMRVAETPNIGAAHMKGEILRFRDKLPSDQFNFFSDLSKYPSFSKFWSVENTCKYGIFRGLDGPGLDAFRNSCDSEEKIMVDFFINVWRKDDITTISLIDVGHLLEKHDREVIAKWILDPYYP